MFQQLIFETLEPANRKLSERLSDLTNRLDEVGRLNYDAGNLELDEFALKAAGGVLSLALLVLSLYISLMLRWNNTPRGVCLQGNWPTPWIGMVVWAKGR